MIQQVLVERTLDLETEAPGLYVYKRQSAFFLLKDSHSGENMRILPYPRSHVSCSTLGKSCSLSGFPFLSCKSRMMIIYCVGNCKDKRK